jgi:hypothetical protein
MGMATKPFLILLFFFIKRILENSIKHSFASRTFLTQNIIFGFQKFPSAFF